MLDALLHVVAPWLATWLLHSTAFLLVVWLLVRVVRRITPDTEVALWRAALVGSLITATLPLLLDLGVPTTALELATTPPVEAAPTHELRPTTPPIPSDAPPVPTAPEDGAHSDAPPAAVALGDAEAHPGAARAVPPVVHATAATPRRIDWAPLVGGIWLLGMLWLSIRAVRARRGFQHRVRDRAPLADPELVALLGQLARRAGLRRAPRLTVSDRLRSPVALGIRRPEICLPARAVAALAPAQQQAMLAHELGHVVRRDALWMPIERWISTLLCLQPLLLVARRRIRDATELACDGFAIRLTEEPLALAECLAEVAGWMHPPRAAITVPAMAATPSLLARRVDHLLAAPRRRRARSRTAAVCVVVLTLAVGLGVPGFRVAGTLATADAAVPTPDARPPEGLAGHETDSPVERPTGLAAELQVLDAELAALQDDLDTLDALGAKLRNHPDVRTAIERLVRRSRTLTAKRNALALGENR